MARGTTAGGTPAGEPTFGIFKSADPKGGGLHDRVADFSFQSDSIAQMIVEAWTDPHFQTWLLTPGPDGTTAPNAKAALEERGIYLANPVVITEADYYKGYHLHDPHGVVFVLPDEPRTAAPPPHRSLLETAKLLMACTPNGI
jgi:hypothetical protein